MYHNSGVPSNKICVVYSSQVADTTCISSPLFLRLLAARLSILRHNNVVQCSLSGVFTKMVHACWGITVRTVHSCVYRLLFNIVRLWCFTTYTARLHSRFIFPDITLTVSSLFFLNIRYTVSPKQFLKEILWGPTNTHSPVYRRVSAFSNVLCQSYSSTAQSRILARVLGYVRCYHVNVNCWYLSFFGIYYKWCSMQLNLFVLNTTLLFTNCTNTTVCLVYAFPM